jgi:hypothetical protein
MKSIGIRGAVEGHDGLGSILARMAANALTSRAVYDLPSKMDQITLRNRLLLASGMWRETIGGALPRMPKGDPEDQLQQFELELVNRLWDRATPDTAREIADRTWDLVHDRPDSDPVKQRVVECHEALARMTRLGD